MRAFTLTELLVSIGIIAVLIGILLPVLSKAREKGNLTMCLSNEHQILVAILDYANQHNGYLPGPTYACVNDPRIVNVQPGQPPIDPSHPDWSQMDVWDNGITANGVLFSTRELSSMALLQSYFGSPSNYKIWQYPSAMELWDNAFPITPDNATVQAYFYGDHLGYGYQLNDGFYWGSTFPPYLFGNGFFTDGSSIEMPKKINQIRATTWIDPNADPTNPVEAAPLTSTFSSDPSKIWLMSDLDGRNGTFLELGFTFTISGVVLKPPYTIEERNIPLYQPVHGGGAALPTTADPHSQISRNYGFLDGHVETLLYGDWPGATVGPIPN